MAQRLLNYDMTIHMKIIINTSLKQAPGDNIPTENDDKVNPNHNKEDYKNKGEPNNDRDDQDQDTEDINDIDVPNNNKKTINISKQIKRAIERADPQKLD